VRGGGLNSDCNHSLIALKRGFNKRQHSNSS
jgi:hypothetical protein